MVATHTDTLLPALPYAEARDLYAEACNAAAAVLRDPAAWSDALDADGRGILAELLDNMESARKVHQLAVARAGIHDRSHSA